MLTAVLDEPERDGRLRVQNGMNERCVVTRTFLVQYSHIRQHAPLHRLQVAVDDLVEDGVARHGLLIEASRAVRRRRACYWGHEG